MSSSRHLSLNNLIANPSFITRNLVKIVDKALGISAMDSLYQKHNMQDMSKEDFADKLIEILALNIVGIEQLQANIPKTGPVVIASNHPFGGIEGVILARVISQVRPDLKVFANKALGIFEEIRDYFIFTNPLSEKDPSNAPSLRQCIRHVNKQGALLIFPAGRVSYYRADKKAVSEHEWNKIVGKLVSINSVKFVPVFINGTNTKLFYLMGRIQERLRMLMLARELLNKTGKKVVINSGFAVDSTLFDCTSHDDKAQVCRAISYAQDANWHYDWPADQKTDYKALLAPVEPSSIANEINALPSDQLLLTQKQFKVYFASQYQAPQVVTEIASLRELVFRQHNEGSGEAIDTDNFDATYTHLFIVKDNAEIIGAYRMGQTDLLLEKSGLDGLYLHKMFAFSDKFVNQQAPCLEMGRSFLVPEYQRSPIGLLLLWRGIGAFLCKHPQYRTLYGTVSISKLYNPRSVKLIEQGLIETANSLHVKPRNGFDFAPHPEIEALNAMGLLGSNINAFLASLESDGKSVPVLVKQYQRMGAKFHALGIDHSFNHTPGLLLSVTMDEAPIKQVQKFLGEGYREYLQFNAKS